MNFYVGQKVVCIKTKGLHVGARQSNWPLAISCGGHYTIRRVAPHMIATHGEMGLWFEEYHHPPYPSGWETGFPSSCFSPLEAVEDIESRQRELIA